MYKLISCFWFQAISDDFVDPAEFLARLIAR